MDESTKVCNVCLIEQSTDLFYAKDKTCKTCRLKKNKARADKNKAQKAIKDREYRAKNKQRISKQRKEYYEKNKESILQRCKNLYYRKSEQIKSRHKRYRKEHRERNINISFFHNSARRVLTAGFNARVEVDITKQDVLRTHGNICYICGKPVDFSYKPAHKLSASIDHVIPISRGGSHTIENLRVVHFGCNSHKHSKMPSELEIAIPKD